MGSGQEALQGCESWLGRPSEAVAAELESFCQLLLKWNATQNLVSRETVNELWERHIADSLQLLPLLGDAKRIMDLGSGGGFPALPLAIALKGTEARFLLVETIGKKVAFLRTVIRELQLAAEVLPLRAEALDRDLIGGVDVFTSRALAALPLLLGLVAPLWTPQSRALFHKGREHLSELEESCLAWDFDVLIHRSTTDRAGVVLEISNLRAKTT